MGFKWDILNFLNLGVFFWTDVIFMGLVFFQLVSFFQRFVSASGPGLGKSSFVGSSWADLTDNSVPVHCRGELRGLFFSPLWGKCGFLKISLGASHHPWIGPVVLLRAILVEFCFFFSSFGAFSVSCKSRWVTDCSE